MQHGPDLSALAAVYEKAKSFVVFIHPQATYDAVAAGLALRLALKEAGKTCEVVCEEPMRVEFSQLVDIDAVQLEAGNRDLVLSFAYSEEQVDKVTYNVDEDSQRFELVISPKSGGQPLDPSTIDFRRSGLSADVAFLFGFHALDELGEIYVKEKYTIDSAFTVAITQGKIPPYAKLHITLQPEHFSYSELIYFALRQLQVAEVKDDLATNLLSGIEYATDRLTAPTMTARTFETVANLLRRGGRRNPANPAFQNLGMPIRPAPAAPRQARPAFPMKPGMPAAPGFDGPMEEGEWTPTSAFPGTMTPTPTPPTHSVSPADFARAMANRS